MIFKKKLFLRKKSLNEDLIPHVKQKISTKYDTMKKEEEYMFGCGKCGKNGGLIKNT